MDYFAGLDVSVKETSLCIVDDAGKIVEWHPALSDECYASSRKPAFDACGLVRYCR